MTSKTIPMKERKTIALVAHDNKKDDLLQWVLYNEAKLNRHTLVSTGTTGSMIDEETDLEVNKLESGPLGGDQQLGARISRGEIDLIIFFWDPLEPHPHDPDVKALLRMAVVWNVPVACNRASADFMFSSELVDQPYDRTIPDYDTYKDREVVVEPPEV